MVQKTKSDHRCHFQQNHKHPRQCLPSFQTNRRSVEELPLNNQFSFFHVSKFIPLSPNTWIIFNIIILSTLFESVNEVEATRQNLPFSSPDRVSVIFLLLNSFSPAETDNHPVLMCAGSRYPPHNNHVRDQALFSTALLHLRDFSSIFRSDFKRRFNEDDLRIWITVRYLSSRQEMCDLSAVTGLRLSCKTVFHYLFYSRSCCSLNRKAQACTVAILRLVRSAPHCQTWPTFLL